MHAHVCTYYIEENDGTKYLCSLYFIGNELLRDHYVKTELFTAELMVLVKPFTSKMRRRREDQKTNSLTDQPSSDIAYERLSTLAPTMVVTLWKAEHHHVTLCDEVTRSHLSMARFRSVLLSTCHNHNF
ncbi:hypothetical protein Hanom_Chr11g01049001 [Helianthus anomalus]